MNFSPDSPDVRSVCDRRMDAAAEVFRASCDLLKRLQAEKPLCGRWTRLSLVPSRNPIEIEIHNPCRIQLSHWLSSNPPTMVKPSGLRSSESAPGAQHQR